MKSIGEDMTSRKKDLINTTTPKTKQVDQLQEEESADDRKIYY